MRLLALLLVAALLAPPVALASEQRSRSHPSSPYRSSASRSHYRDGGRHAPSQKLKAKRSTAATRQAAR